MSEKLPVRFFRWVERIFQFIEDFIKNYNEDGDIGYYLEVDAQYLVNYMSLTMIFHFYQ